MDSKNSQNAKLVTEWNNYLLSVESRLNNIWYLVNYNKFTDIQIEKYQREVKNLNRCILSLRNKNNNLWKQNNDNKKIIENKNNKIFRLNKLLDKLEDKIYKLKNPEPKSRKRPREDEDSFTNLTLKKKPKNYVRIEDDERDKKLLEIFNSIETITDIIKLKDSCLIYDFLESEKFSKIFELIPSLEKLDKMIGMNKLKEQIFSMICYCLHQMNSEEDLNHIVIMGPPGTGKTTVAHILGEIYKSLGFLSNDTFIKARRSDLIAEYLGQTAVKTQKLLDKAEGGVLFIDEVYSLGNPEKRDSFAKECIDTINQNLTEKSNNLLVIIAGYKDEVKNCFFSYNPGLERRFPLQFTIEKYTEEELHKILLKTISLDKWEIKENVSLFLFKNIKKNYKLFKYMGGDMQTLFKFAKENYSRRLMRTLLTLDSPKELIISDFKYAINRFRENRDKKNNIPEYVKSMYV